MRNVIFVAPFPMETTLKFARALSKLRGVRLIGVMQEAPRGDNARIFDDVFLVQDGTGTGDIAKGVEAARQKYGPIHRIIGVLENIQDQIAEVRQLFDVPGTRPETANLFRDKARMKDALREAGLPCARHKLLANEAQAWEFIDEVGFPIVLKPPAGAGCKATYRVESPQDLAQALAESRPSPHREVLAEEFLTGSEFSFETLTLGGQPMWHSISRYYPAPLEVMRNPWIQWVVILPRDIYGKEFDLVRKVGTDTIRHFQLGTSMTHMEWFRRPDGSVAIGEIAARPPGAQIVKLNSYAYDTDMHFNWARLMVDEAYDGPWERKFAVGCAFLRGMGEGRVKAVEGIAEAQRRFGHLVVEADLPRVGAPRNSGYEGEGYVIVRHPDTEVVKKAVLELITTVKVHYTG